jgi:hypothetical protein
MFNSFQQIIDLWPSRAALARDMGVSYCRARQWYDRNRIPAEYWIDLVESAENISAARITYKNLAELIRK